MFVNFSFQPVLSKTTPLWQVLELQVHIPAHLKCTVVLVCPSFAGMAVTGIMCDSATNCFKSEYCFMCGEPQQSHAFQLVWGSEAAFSSFYLVVYCIRRILKAL
jgi:hypothetical protein